MLATLDKPLLQLSKPSIVPLHYNFGNAQGFRYSGSI
jgi:hypothetical protein